MAARIENIRVTVTTGKQGLEGPVRIRFNGFEIDLNRISGGTEPGETYEGEFFVGSVAQSCELLGPPSGTWDIKEVTVELDHEDDQVTCSRFGPASLDADATLDVLKPPPPPCLEV